MAQQVRYLVSFVLPAGIYQAGDVVTLTAEEYAREKARPRPTCHLVEEWHEELDGNRVPVPGSKRVVRASQPPPAPSGPAAEMAALRRQVAELQERAVLGGEPALARLESEIASLTAANAALKQTIEEARAGAIAGSALVADLQAKNDALIAEVAALKAKKTKG